jgi:hypothetical protein
MTKKAKILWILLVGVSLLLAACGPSAAPAETTATQVDPNAVFTAAAETANAKMTEMAAQTPSPAPATATSTLTSAASPTVGQTTAVITATATLATPGAGAGAGAGASTGGDNSQYVADVTIPDGTNFSSNESFVKTWRVQNTGTSTWTTSYSLNFVSGAPMTSTTKVALPQEVGPGQTLDISVNLTAPAEPGNYQGFWQLSNAQGTVFGVQIYVDINVTNGAGASSSTPGTPGTPSASAATATPGTSGTAGSTVTQVTLTVESATVQSSCPYTFRFPASVTMNKDGKVTYRLEAGSNTDGFEFSSLPGASTTNLSAGTHTFNYELAINASMSGWARLHVTSPDDVTSTEVTYTLTCQ